MHGKNVPCAFFHVHYKYMYMFTHVYMTVTLCHKKNNYPFKSFKTKMFGHFEKSDTEAELIYF